MNKELSKIENKLLEMFLEIDRHGIEITESDLQGFIQAQIRKAYLLGKGTKWTKKLMKH